MTKGICRVEDCEKPVHSRRMCQKHYRRHMATQAERCSVDECEGPVIARDLCPKHYARWATHGSPHALMTTAPRPREMCSVGSCDQSASARTWCKRHYERWRLHGDPLATLRKTRPWAIIDPELAEHRECASCRRSLPMFEFAPHRTKAERLDTCRKCVISARHERFGGVPSDQHHYKIMLKFGITDADYQEMTKAQDGRCAICRRLPYGGRQDARKKYLAVDHCHTTNKIRGLLCDNCNLALGLFQDDVERMAAAIEYLKQAAS